ncbi:protein kinase domain-containing protein [Paludisphaera borealis]|uniref:Serine/threonine-protein kinase PknB n=1 Tax=Paludisphaera borealis TaxID=1387353 RepID=A0A1U7CUP8_9BACT|nr:protein kinase [Paludisphaera borealis]APW62651.1 Serine/threonine-protein kinase PknB [Paludisphaera borealis]
MSATDQPPHSWSSFDLLERSRGGGDAAAAALFARYFARLTSLAKSRLPSQIASRIDPEDVVMSVFRSFFVDARDGRYVLGRKGDLWRLLAAITKHKLMRQTRFHRADRRSIDLDAPLEQIDETRLVRLLEPTPEDAVDLADLLNDFTSGLSPLDGHVLELRMREMQIPEIAREVGCSERSVRRSLSRLRSSFLDRLSSDQNGLAPDVETLPSALLDHGDFLLQRMIGSGRMGKVFKAWQRGEDRPVAVKFLRKSLIHHPGAVRRFLAEAQTIAELRHPKIVGTHGLGRTPGGSYFLVMEYVAGSNLDLHTRRSDVSWRQAVVWVVETCQALEHAHARGIVHCDLKPANLLIDENGGVRVTDFGLARHLSDPTPRTVHIEGTAPYMAPEQASRSWGPIDARTDVYGLGAVLFALLTGRPPWIGGSLPEVLAKVVGDEPVVSPGLIRPDLPTTVVDVCRKCLAKRPRDRYGSVMEVRAALVPLIEER